MNFKGRTEKSQKTAMYWGYQLFMEYVCMYVCMYVCICIYLSSREDIFSLLSEREEVESRGWGQCVGERHWCERETLIDCPLVCTLTGGLNLQPRYVPRENQTHNLLYGMMHQPTETHWLGVFWNAYGWAPKLEGEFKYTDQLKEFWIPLFSKKHPIIL